MKNITSFDKILKQECLLENTMPILVGVSGGPDSLSLLHYLWRKGYLVIAAHANHHLRPDADSEAAFVTQFARSREIKIAVGDIDVLTYARSNSLSVEEAARSLRYKFLFQQAREYHSQTIAVAHTADDQIETILMHLLRGAGLSGLVGMKYRTLPNPWSDDIALARPFLGVFREEILEYCSKENLQPVFDHSNLDITFFRNRLRQQLLPELETYNPKIKPVLLRMGEILSSDEQIIEEYTKSVWEKICIEQGSKKVGLITAKFIKEPLGIQRRLFRYAINILRPGLRDIDFETIERAIAFVKQPSRSGQINLIKKMNLVMDDDTLWVINWNTELPSPEWPQMVIEPKTLPIPGRVNISGGWFIHSEIIDSSDEVLKNIQNNQDPFCAWLNIGSDSLNFQVRVMRPGDRLEPLGMPGKAIKLKDFYINVKMPRKARQAWPLICLKDAIVWIPGYRLAHPYRVTIDCHTVIFLQLLRNI